MFRSLVFFLPVVLRVMADDVRMPPNITSGPTPDKWYRRYDKIRLECTATGNPKPIFSWKKNGNPVDLSDPAISWPDQSVGTIEILNAEGQWSGYYQCWATNAHGTALSITSSVHMAQMRPFTGTGTTPYPVQEGSTMMLPCEQLPCVPPAAYKWALAVNTEDTNPTTLVLDNRRQIDQYGNLHFAYTIKDDEKAGKMYKCLMKNWVLDVEQGGSHATLSVTAVSPVPKSAPTPAFKTQSPFIGVAGDTVHMRCMFYGNPIPKPAWSKQNGMLPPSPRWYLDPQYFQTEATLKNLTLDDGGIYVCTGTNELGTTNQTIELRVETRPTFVPNTNHLSNTNVTEGDSVSFNCQSNGIPSPSVVWFRSGVKLDPNSLPMKYGISSDGLTLTISNLCKNCPPPQTEDLTVIQCNASNTHGYVYAQGFVNVVLRTIITDSSVTIQWVPQEKVVFPCHSKSDDITPVTYKWFFNSQPLVYDSTVQFDLIQQTLYITTANDTDFGKSRVGIYQCVVTNGVSNATLDHQLTNEGSIVTADSNLWLIAVIIGAIILIIIIILLVWILFLRNRGESYSVDANENKAGNNPQQDLLKDQFKDYQRTTFEKQPSRSGSQSHLVNDTDENIPISETA